MGALFFFVKQSTAYEMLISDWSSDVCSSDLALPLYVAPGGGGEFPDEGLLQLAESPVVELPPVRKIDDMRRAQRIAARRYLSNDGRRAPGEDRSRLLQRQRSEEHTSELPSLMRISYAVLCLKKN